MSKTSDSWSTPSRRAGDSGHVSERTPLLRSDAADSDVESASSTLVDPEPNSEGAGGERTIICNEPSFTWLALVMSTAWFGVFLGAADTTIIATLSAPISSEFNSLRLLSWLATAYLISNAASQPISGRLTDIFGRGPGLVFANLAFALGNLICALATSQQAMILGRLIAGIGGGGLMSIPTFLASDLIPLRQRGVVGGIANIWYGCGTMVGAVFGGYLNDHSSMGWRLAFLIQVPPSLISAIIVYFLVKVPPKQSDKSYLKRIDFGGVFLTSSFLALLVLGLSFGGNIVPWTHPLPPVTLLLSVGVFIALFRWERTAAQPIIPVKLLYNRTVLASCLASIFCSAIALTSIFYVPLYLQVRGDSATAAGLKILPVSLGTSAGALGTGYLMKRTGKYVGLVISCILALTFGVGMFTFQNENTAGWLTSIAFLIVGGGYTAVFGITQVACLAAVDHTQQAVVTSCTYLARSLGGTIGITIASVIYQSTLRTDLWERFGDQPNAAERIQRILDDMAELGNLPNGWMEGVTQSFMGAFLSVWLMMLAWAVLALICISPIKQHQLHVTLDRK
ncbi:major facilitator superfamily domain-containing protein [Xylariaceae sp. AK1471]|nr:major facilitator superfamily domain-containing protein [Xylariaceae sp. AK1471]